MRILIVRNNSNPQAIDASLLLSAYLSSQGIDWVTVDSSSLETIADRASVRRQCGENYGLAVALGGDGTILRTAHLVHAASVPVLGINFGNLGFLANSSENGVIAPVAQALAGEATVENRANLAIRVIGEGSADPWADNEDDADDLATEEALRTANASRAAAGEHVEEGPFEYFALNELAITRGSNGHIIAMGLDIAGSHVVNLRGDGLVVATATGSTAYALSAGGPLVAPSHQGLVVVPIAPHTLQSRAIVTAPNDVVEVRVGEVGDYRKAVLFVDGELLSFERPVRRVYVRRGERPTRLLRCGAESFYAHASQVFF